MLIDFFEKVFSGQLAYQSLEEIEASARNKQAVLSTVSRKR